MPQTFTTTGGARLGWTNASWPLAQLVATPEALTLSVRLLGTYSFAANQVSSLEKYGWIRILGSGVRIHHCNPHCPEKVVFWSFGNADKVLHGIEEAGFRPKAPPDAVVRRPGIATRWTAIIMAIAVWNAMFMLNPAFSGNGGAHPALMLAPLALAFAVCVGLFHSQILQRLILKPGRTVGEIAPFLRLLAFITGILLLVFSILVAFGVFDQIPHR